MKKNILLIVLAFIIAPSLASAHPGRLAKDGGHFCLTNCYQWGLTFGMRHYHIKLPKPQKKIDAIEKKQEFYPDEPKKVLKKKKNSLKIKEIIEVWQNES